MSNFIRKFLDISTRHLPERVANGPLNSFEGVTAYEDEYGAWLWVPTDVNAHLIDYPDVPEAVQRLWRYARKKDCDYIRLDRDASVHPHLDTWDWP